MLLGTQPGILIDLPYCDTKPVVWPTTSKVSSTVTSAVSDIETRPPARYGSPGEINPGEANIDPVRYHKRRRKSEPTGTRNGHSRTPVRQRQWRQKMSRQLPRCAGSVAAHGHPLQKSPQKRSSWAPILSVKACHRPPINPPIVLPLFNSQTTPHGRHPTDVEALPGYLI
jgi:hypothetical protein